KQQKLSKIKNHFISASLSFSFSLASSPHFREILDVDHVNYWGKISEYLARYRDSGRQKGIKKE
ncbi:hypothetical protein P3528_24290, partial [Vibrio parahaemolyticus]|nr:hypothetical protein [Vibrio parahaemolyticus]